MITKADNNENRESKKTVCWSSPGCHDRCGLVVTVRDGQIVGMRGNREYPSLRDAVCSDRLPHFLKWLHHPDQLMHPLKRVGERGENKWERVSWDQALDEIADKLAQIKAEYGAESLGLIEGTYRSDLYVIRSRFLNLFGNPGNIGCPGTVCLCNRAALRYALLGTAGFDLKIDAAKCVVLSGWNITEAKLGIWQKILRRRMQAGSDFKLIIIDPRRTEAARQADLWLQIRPGTDTALLLAWIHVIIEEGLYDEVFVNNWTFGFDELRRRASEYTPERVAEITWIPAGQIRESARVYATHSPAILNCVNWGVAADQIGPNGTRAEQARICLSAITGSLAVQGCETAIGPGPLINGVMGIRDSMLQLEEKCPPEQRRKQLGSDKFKLMTWPGYEIMNELYKEKYGLSLCMSGHNFLSPEPLVWQAILARKPYPIKALITWTSNPLLNAPNTRVVYQALKSPNLGLHVVLEHFMTPTALLADYVLPAASKFEKPMCSTFEDFAAVITCGERAIKPMGERRSDYDFFRGLAVRLGFGDYFPWETEEELADYRLKPLGMTFKEVATERYVVGSSEPWTYETIDPKTGNRTGFATASGRVELYSNVLEKLGYDPLPFYEEPVESHERTPDAAKDYPLILITGGKFRPQFHSENRQFGMGMREQHPDPLVDIHPETAQGLNIAEGDWVNIETRRGAIKQRARLNSGIHPMVVNVQSHWWFPEQPAEEPSLHGAWQSNANVLTTDEADALDPITGGWPLRALLCRVSTLKAD